jgi:hypothetical protein
VAYASALELKHEGNGGLKGALAEQGEARYVVQGLLSLSA